jgi:hypothetical protein
MTIESIKIKPLVIQEGRRYVMRYGGITGVMRKNIGAIAYRMTDGELSWTEEGQYHGNDPLHGRDIIAEYIPQQEPLPFVLKAGGKYETVKPDGSPGPVVEPRDNQYSAGVRTHFPMHAETPCGYACVSVNGELFHATNGCLLYRIVREHVPQLTPIERLEKQAAWQVDAPKFAELSAIIADLKAAVKS